LGLALDALFFRWGGHRACVLDGCRARLLQRAAPALDIMLFLIWGEGGRKRAGSWEEDGKREDYALGVAFASFGRLR